MTQVSSTPKPLPSFQSALESLSSFKDDPSWLQPLRRTAASRFTEKGFPTRKDEAWKHTSLRALQDMVFSLAEKKGISKSDLAPLLEGRENWPRLVFINGFYAEDLSQPGEAKDYLSHGWTDAGKASLEASLGAGDFFTDLNTAFLSGVTTFHLKKDVQLEQPVLVLQISIPEAGTPCMHHPRIQILAERGSRASWVEQYVSFSGEGAYFRNPVTDIRLEANASLDHYKIFREGEKGIHISTTRVSQARDSRFRTWSLATAGQLVRNGIHIRLEEEGAACVLDGLYLVEDRRIVDNTLLIEHLKPHGTSEQLYKGILDGRSQAVFNGKVYVHPGAIKSDASQTNKNLLLSEEAVVDTRPQLEIYNDDVKCSHGAAVGQISRDALFYFKSRGVNEETARKLISYGFASEVTRRIPLAPLASDFDRLLLRRMGPAAEV